MHDIAIGSDLLADNDEVARHNRAHFAAHGVHVVNVMSAPGAGKTTLLERTLAELAGRLRIGVIEGDVESREDADRIARHGVPVVQVNTGGACHLDARLVDRQLPSFDLDALDLLIVENVGNLVCPAEFDLGEHDRVMLLSVAEGDDKPSKYPVMFHVASLLLLTKVDLLPHVDFDPERAACDARALNAGLEVLQLSARTGAGLDAWCRWLVGRVETAG